MKNQGCPLLQNIFSALVVADELSLFHGDDAAADGVHDAFVMGGEEDGRAELVDLLQDADDVIGVRRVEIAGRLVGDDDVRMVDDGPGDGHALFLAAGELVREIPHLVGQIDELEDMRHVRGNFPCGPASGLHGKGDVLVGGLVRNEPIILEDHADAAAIAGHVVLADLVDVGRFKKDRAGSRPVLGDEHLHQRRLAGARMLRRW